jgi:hypothetical protein
VFRDPMDAKNKNIDAKNRKIDVKQNIDAKKQKN